MIISIWGEINSYISRKINREGEIFIENIGILNLSDKNLEQAKTYVNSKFARVYSTLTGENPKSFVDLSLGELKSVNIHFVGFVNIPGVHTIHPFSNIVAGLTQAGGVDFRGSLRSIELIRNDKTIAVFDLYDYIFKGKSITSVRLMDQDIIFVPPRLSRVALNGQVLTAGYFEISKDETLQNLINFFSKQLASATSQLFLYSLAKNTSKIINNKSFTNFYLSDGDSIFAPKKPDFNKFVKIEGQVKKPGKYPFEDGMSLEDLIIATQSTLDQEYMKTVDVEKIQISRKIPHQTLRYILLLT